MKLRYLRIGGIVALVCMLFTAAPAPFAAADEDASQLLVGSWCGESVHSGQSVNAREFRYHRVKSGVDYSMVRVPADFRLP